MAKNTKKDSGDSKGSTDVLVPERQHVIPIEITAEMKVVYTGFGSN